MKLTTIITASLVLACSAAQAQKYECHGVTHGVEPVFSNRYSIETHQGLTEMAVMAEGIDHYTIIANYDANRPEPNDDSTHMTFRSVVESQNHAPLNVIIRDDWMRIETGMYSEYCREEK